MTAKRFSAAAVPVALLVSLLAWLWWATTPTYSLQQVLLALEHHDVVAFEHYVDVAGVASRLIDDASADFESSAHTFGASYLADEDLARAVSLRVMKPQLVQIVKEQARRAVESGDLSQDERSTEAGGVQVSLADMMRKVSGTDRLTFV